MRVSWTDTGKGRFAPLLNVGFRRHGQVMLISPRLLVDTGADGTVLPRFNAKLLGLRDSDLVAEECGVAGARIIVHRLVNLTRTEIEIHGRWLQMPSLVFADQILHPLLGRDIIFQNFDLHMTKTYFELIPLSPA
jgi:predicted aspartyl protease